MRNVPEVTAKVPEKINQSVSPQFEGATKTFFPVLKNRLKSEQSSLNCGNEDELNIVINKIICFSFIRGNIIYFKAIAFLTKPSDIFSRVLASASETPALIMTRAVLTWPPDSLRYFSASL